MSILIIAAIALAVVLGYKTKINTGFFETAENSV